MIFMTFILLILDISVEKTRFEIDKKILK